MANYMAEDIKKKLLFLKDIEEVFVEVTFNPEGVVDICSPGRSYEVGLNGVI